uniref:C2H2-type domain-containing protein n=1 Tax=Oncorhynchus tshawytscha TaxID=74940 RepID=A0AAZ3PHA0_ONCTS
MSMVAMDDQQEDPEGMYDVQHQYMCSECHQLFNTLEEVLMHQQIHTGQEGEEGEAGEAMAIQGISEYGDSQYQCLECGALLRNPDELLLHQELHMREVSGPVQYQCLDCLALFDSPEVWLAHRQTHSKSSTLPPSPRPPPGPPSHPPSPPSRLGHHVVIFHPYECSECALLFQTPEDFLQHQGEHFLAQEKESGEDGVMMGYEGDRGREEEREEENGGRVAEERGKGRGRRALAKRSRNTPLCLHCSQCQRTFTSANRLAAHRRVHEHGTYECRECDKVFKKAMSLQTHMRSHSGEARYLCVDCGHGFNTEMTLIIHRKSHTAEPLHRCEHCAKTFTNMTKFLYHRRTHTKTSQPGEHTADPGSSTDPNPSGPAGPRGAFPCPSCPQAFPSLLRLVKHRHTAHVSERHFKCSVCTKTFKKHMHLRNHLRTHTGERPFQCSDCGKTFSSLANLSRHNLTHSGVRPYRCDICHRTFTQSSNLRQHRLLHANLPPCPCPDCPATFVRPAKLAPTRPHACLVCGKAFKSFSNLRNHRKTHARQQRQEEVAAAQVAMETSAAVALVETQGTPTIMCNEFGETIAIIETSEGGTLPLAEAIEIYHTALENSLGMDSISVDSLQLI